MEEKKIVTAGVQRQWRPSIQTKIIISRRSIVNKCEVKHIGKIPKKKKPIIRIWAWKSEERIEGNKHKLTRSIQLVNFYEYLVRVMARITLSPLKLIFLTYKHLHDVNVGEKTVPKFISRKLERHFILIDRICIVGTSYEILFGSKVTDQQFVDSMEKYSAKTSAKIRHKTKFEREKKKKQLNRMNFLSKSFERNCVLFLFPLNFTDQIL